MTGILGGWELFGGIPQAVYVCDKTESSVVNVNVCNRGNVATRISMAISDSTSIVNDAGWFEYESLLVPKGTVERTGIVVNPGKYLIIKSSLSNTNAMVWGVTLGEELTTPAITQNLGTAPTWTTPAGTIATVSNSTVTFAASENTTTYSVISGSLPAGSILDESTGVLSSFTRPVSTTNYTFGLRAASGSGLYADRTFTVAVSPPPPVDTLYRNEGTTAITSGWNNTNTYSMSDFGGIANVTAHGGVGGPVTFTLTLTGLPTHTDIRYKVYWHMVDSLDGETSSLYTSDNTGSNVLRARWTKSYPSTPSYSTLNITGTWSGAKTYSYRPWGGGAYGGDGYAQFDTGFYTHTASTFTAVHEMGYDQAISDEAMYLSHVEVWLSLIHI
jgi:hypothetical protein